MNVLLPRISVLTGRGALTLSSFGGEGEPLAGCSTDACEVQAGTTPEGRTQASAGVSRPDLDSVEVRALVGVGGREGHGAA